MALTRAELLKLRSALEVYAQPRDGIFYGERTAPIGEGVVVTLTTETGTLTPAQMDRLSEIFQGAIGRDFSLNEDVLVGPTIPGVAYSDNGQVKGAA